MPIDRNKKLQKLIGFAQDKHLSVFDELNEISDNTEKISEIFQGFDPAQLQMIKGEKGDQGLQGESIEGPMGPQGPQGPQGEQGPEGKAFRGSKGDQGDGGERGPIGPKGDQGDKGSDGKNGSPDSADDIKDKLESLKGEKRLDKSAIKGIEAVETFMANPRMYGNTYSKVYTAGGLTGSGSQNDPLIAVSAGIPDGDKGDITVSNTGATWTVDNGLNATKIGTGVVNNTEFGYLDGVTSGIQGQLNNKKIKYLVASSTAPDETKALADYVATGTADQTVINTAISAANTAGGGEVRIVGSFNTTNTVVMKSNVSLKGDGNRKAIITGSGSNYNLIHTVKVGISKTVYSNIEIIGITFVSNFGTISRIRNTTNVSIRDCEWTYGITADVAINESLWTEHCQFVRIQNNYLHDFTGDGIQVNGCDYFTVVGNTVKGSSTSIGGDDLIDIDKDFGDTATVPSRYGTVTGNSITGGPAGNGIRIGSSDYTTISSNTVDNVNGGSGIRVNSYDTDAVDYGSHNVTITNNIVTNCLSAGVEVSGTNVSAIVVQSNNIYNCGQDGGTNVRAGVLLNSSNVTVLGNYIDGSLKTGGDGGGIVFYKSNGHIIQSNIVANSATGIRAWNGNGTTVYNNVSLLDNKMVANTTNYNAECFSQSGIYTRTINNLGTGVGKEAAYPLDVNGTILTTKLGIGTLNPSQSFHVSNGAILVQPDPVWSSGDQATIYFGSTSTFFQAINGGTNNITSDNPFNIKTSGSANITISPNNTLAVTIASGGGVTLASLTNGIVKSTAGLLSNAVAGTDYIVPASAFTVGSVAFANGSGQLAQDNPNFFWDDINNRLGIGTSNPTQSLHISNGAILVQPDATWSNGDQATIYLGATSTYIRAINGGTNTFTSDNPLDLKTTGATKITITPNNTTAITVLPSGNVGIGSTVTSPTAVLHLKAGTATANTAPLKLTTGTALTTPEDGAVEYHSSHLYFTIGSTRYQLDQQFVNTTATVATTDATQTTLYTFPLPASTTTAIETTIVARRTGGTAGTTDDGGRWRLSAVYKNTGGAASIIGSITSLAADKSQVGFDATLTISGANVLVRVTGAVNNNINWSMALFRTYQIA